MNLTEKSKVLIFGPISWIFRRKSAKNGYFRGILTNIPLPTEFAKNIHTLGYGNLGWKSDPYQQHPLPPPGLQWISAVGLFSSYFRSFLVKMRLSYLNVGLYEANMFLFILTSKSPAIIGEFVRNLRQKSAQKLADILLRHFVSCDWLFSQSRDAIVTSLWFLCNPSCQACQGQKGRVSNNWTGQKWSSRTGWNDTKTMQAINSKLGQLLQYNIWCIVWKFHHGW